MGLSVTRCFHRFTFLRRAIPRLAFAGLALTALSGCLETSGTGQVPFADFLGGSDSGPHYKRAVKVARLANGSVIVPAPRGYCIDPATLSRASGDSFAILASCAALGAGPNFDASLFTVTVSKRQPDLTAPGIRALIAGIKAQGVLSQRERDGIAIVQLARGGDQSISDADPKYWRAVFELNDRLVSLAAYGEKNSPLARSLGGSALERLAQAIRKESPVRPGISLINPQTQSPRPDAKQTGGAAKNTENPMINLLGRLFE